MNNRIPILMYHQVTPSIHPSFAIWSVTPETFARHMRIIKLLGYTTINLDQLMDYRNGGASLPKKPIIITFDDGLQEAIDYTVPILEAYGFTAVYYIPGEFIGSRSHWLLPELGVEFPIINWDVIERLDRKGFQVGSHSMTHPALPALSYEDCLSELSDSRKILEDRLGRRVLHLAYPFGFYNESVRSAAEEAGYETASTCVSAFCTDKDDSLTLPRINISGSDTLLDFVSKISFSQDARFYISGRVPEPVKKFVRRIINSAAK